MDTPYSEILILSDNLNGNFFTKLRELSSTNLSDDEFIKIEEHCDDPRMYVTIKPGKSSYIQTGFLRRGMQVKVTFSLKSIEGNEAFIKRIIHYLSLPTKTIGTKALKEEMKELREEVETFIKAQCIFQQAMIDYMKQNSKDENLDTKLKAATESLNGFCKKYNITEKK